MCGGFAYAACVVADSRSTCAGVSFSVVAGRIWSSCSVVRALAIGATTRGWASNQASATAATVLLAELGDAARRITSSTCEASMPTL